MAATHRCQCCVWERPNTAINTLDMNQIPPSTLDTYRIELNALALDWRIFAIFIKCRSLASFFSSCILNTPETNMECSLNIFFYTDAIQSWLEVSKTNTYHGILHLLWFNMLSVSEYVCYEWWRRYHSIASTKLIRQPLVNGSVL